MKDQLFDFLSASPRERRVLARDPSYASTLTAYLGAKGLAEYLKFGGPGHLAPNSAPNVLFVPGVMGSLLSNQKKGGVWWIDVRTRKHLDDLALAPDGSRDASPADRVEPFTVDVSYEPFLNAFDSRVEFGQELFFYDWRRPMAASVDSLVDRVKAMRDSNGNQRVHLVGHSMGGLVIRTALWKRPELWNSIGKVVFVGTPHYGSPAIAGYLKNHFWGFDLFAVLGVYLSRTTFRSMWGVLSLLPAPSGVYPGTRPGEIPWKDDHGNPGHPAANFDLYDATAYKLEDLDAEHTARLQRILDWAKQYHRDLHASHSALAQEQRDRMLMIAGFGKKSLFRLEWDKKMWGLWEKAEKVTDRLPGDPHRDGDGRVPIASARIPYVKTRYVKGVHGGLTNIQEVWEDVFRFLLDEDLQLPESLPAGGGHLALSKESEAPTLDGTALVTPETPDDPGYLTDSPLDDVRFQEIDELIEKGDVPELTRLRIL